MVQHVHHSCLFAFACFSLLLDSCFIRQDEWTTNQVERTARLSFLYPIRWPFAQYGLGLTQIYIGRLVSCTLTDTMSWNQLLTVTLFSSQFQNVPVQLKTLVTDIYVVAGQENIKAVWKEPNLHVRPYKELAVITMAKMPKETLEFWKWDDSGHHAQPHPDSNVPPHLRIDYLTHSSVARLLTGPGLKPLADRFTKNLMIRLSKSEYLNQEWSELPDLFAFMQHQLFPAAVEAMCGELLFSVNPKFVGDFWAFNKGLPYLAKGYPRWMVPSAYRARDTVLNGLKKWHLAIVSKLKCPPIAMDEWSPDFGVELVRFRHDAWSKMPLMNEDAAATEDLGMIWA